MYLTRTRTLTDREGSTRTLTARFPTAAAAEADAFDALECDDVVDVEMLREIIGPMQRGHSGMCSERRFAGPAKDEYRKQCARAQAREAADHDDTPCLPPPLWAGEF